MEDGWKAPLAGARLGIVTLLTLVLPGCFYPGLQTATVRPGFHLDAGAALLADQTRRVGGEIVKEQGPDYISYVQPSYGFGRRFGVELGLRVGVYGEDLTGKSGGCAPVDNCFDFQNPEDSHIPFALPYVKLATAQDQQAKAAVVLGVESVALIGSVEAGAWEPYASLKWIFSGGDPRTDDVPRIISRFQEADQSIWSFGLGLERRTRRRYGAELGIASTSYGGGSALIDPYLAVRIGVR